ncbi:MULTISPECIES: IS630 transposase-related protein [unclassified Wolbachia]|uniref:IS630 transposase-related protein n=1 Tax=unclassified Wolbachia TaxID=2640676 RepID=UPI002220A2E1|nr:MULTISPECIES: IS630 transposase-related protein [unclassified Wolbachia]
MRKKKMPSPYSEDLKERVLKGVDKKTMTIKKISQIFKVSIKPIYLWRKRKKETETIFRLSQRIWP